VWGLAALTGRRVLLRIEDHDRERSRREFATAILEDLDWLGFTPDAGPVRQRDPEPYAAALGRLRDAGLVYACDCTRATFAAWAERNDRGWSESGCPGGCRARSLGDEADWTLRIAVGEGRERWNDGILGVQSGSPTFAGDPPARDRQGNWTYGFAVVVDDLRQGIDLVVRGADLAETTPAQIRLGKLLGRGEPPRFAHHPLILKPNGSKLSKADRDTGIRDLREGGMLAADVIGLAAAAVGLVGAPRSVQVDEVADLVRPRIGAI
jgi:glutamyl-tRNA synthetase/glutamyl-Q tRNA(Asp) synthetase